MSDIDFDELDRAVSSVLGVSPQQLQPTQPVVAPAAPVQPDRFTAPTPAPEVVVSQPEQRTVRSTQATPRPTTGRFMDVVHPSSDMRTAPTSQVEPVVAPPSLETSSLDIPEPQQQPAELDQFELIQDDFITPLESPFLTDAKVEKRPLGAFSPDLADDTAEEVTAPQSPVFDSTIEPAEEALISAIEIGDTDPAASIADEPQMVTEVPVEIEEPMYTEEPAAEPKPLTEAPAFTQAIQPSIPQQYTKQVSTDQQPSGAIFDTESYHQPLAHPQKKKSSALIIFWILGLIVLGAALGVSLYFFVLKGL